MRSRPRTCLCVPGALILRSSATLFLLILTLSAVTSAQEPGVFGGKQSLGIDFSYAPNSSHMLIGQAEKRQTWTSGIEYTHFLHASRHLRFDYEASVLPLFEESDPTLIGTTTVINHTALTVHQTPFRVIYVNSGPIGFADAGKGITAPIYAIYGRESTYGGALSPIGGRVSAFPRSRIQPSLALDLGFVVATRDLPVDLSDRFNYMFSFGPGVQIFGTQHSAVRLEYIYRHISNAHQGYQNPGVDQGTLRVTFSRFR